MDPFSSPSAAPVQTLPSPPLVPATATSATPFRSMVHRYVRLNQEVEMLKREMDVRKKEMETLAKDMERVMAAKNIEGLQVSDEDPTRIMRVEKSRKTNFNKHNMLTALLSYHEGDTERAVHLRDYLYDHRPEKTESRIKLVKPKKT